MTTVIGVDIGTTTIGIAVLERDSGRLVKSITLPNTAALPGSPAGDLQDPDAICHIVEPVLAELVLQEEVCGIGLTGQMHGILYLDGAGRAVSPLYTWRDASGDAPCPLSGEGKSFAAFLSERTGYAMASGYGCTTHYCHTVTGTLPKAAVRFCSLPDYVAMRLAGAAQPLVHVSHAAGFGLFDVQKMRFDAAAMEKAGMSAAFLPKTVVENTVVGTYQGRVPVAVAIGDNQASFLGSVRDTANSVLVNIGTGSQIAFAARGGAPAAGLELRPYMDGGMICTGASLCGGRAFALLEAFFRRTAQLVTQQPVGSAYPGMDAYLEQWWQAHAGGGAPTGALEVSTTFCGTRQAPAQRGAICNIGPENFTPEGMMIGFLYGMARELLELYRGAGVRHPVLVGAGNGLRKNRVLCGIVEEVFAQKLSIPVHGEEAACGAALYALVCAGCCRDIGEAQARIAYQTPEDR